MTNLYQKANLVELDGQEFIMIDRLALKEYMLEAYIESQKSPEHRDNAREFIKIVSSV